MSASPAQDVAVFPAELLKEPVLLQSQLPAGSWHITSAMSEKGDFYLQYLDFELYVSLSPRYYHLKCSHSPLVFLLIFKRNDGLNYTAIFSV